MELIRIDQVSDKEEQNVEESPVMVWMYIAYMYYGTFQNVKNNAFKSKVQLLLTSRIQKHLDFEDSEDKF